MLRVDAYYFANGGKNLRFQKYPDTCGRSLEGLKKESKVRVSKTRGLGLSFFNECCFRVTVKVRVRVDINSKPNLTLTPTVTQKQQSFFFFFF